MHPAILYCLLTAPYHQQLDLTFPDPAAAQAATVDVAPVLGDKAWAFSARWDDNNRNSLNVRERMAKHGLKGTFYLNGTQGKAAYGAEFARELTRDGCSIGGHGVVHAKLPELAPNAMFEEVMRVRIERESQTDQPINSYAFAYGMFQDKEHPAVLPAVTAVLQRAGYTHFVYANFVKDNPHLSAAEVSTSWQVVPGDRKIEEEKFWDNLAKITDKWPQAYRDLSHGIHLGVHPWQEGPVLDELETVFAKLAGRDDFWYCNLTEWAAYSRDRATARLTPTDSGQPAAKRFDIARSTPAELGEDLPLTLRVTGAVPVAASLNGEPLELTAIDGGVRCDLPHTTPLGLPAAIDAIDFGSLTATGAVQNAAELTGLAAALRREDDRLIVTLTNGGQSPLQSVRARLRATPAYRVAEGTATVAAIPAGESAALAFELTPSEDPAWSTGARLLVVQLDFLRAERAERLWLSGTD